MSKRACEDDFTTLNFKRIKLDISTRYDINEKHIFSCVNNYLTASNISNFNHVICCVCGESKLRPLDKISSRTKSFILQQRHLLHYSQLRYKFDRKNFEYEGSFNVLNELVLDSNGFNYTTDNLNICASCENYLDKRTLPKYGLINELYIGKVPNELKDLTYAEELVIAKARLIGSIFKIKTGTKFNNQHKLVGNIISFPQLLDDFATILPNYDVLKTLKVIFIGPTIPHNLNLSKLFSIDTNKIIKALKWLKENNHLYANVKIDKASKIPLNSDNVPYYVLDNIIHVKTDDEYENDDEDTKSNDILFERFGLVNNSLNEFINDKEKLDKLQSILKNEKNILIYPHEKEPISEFNNPNLLPMLYPTIFPYGYGGFDDKIRKISLTKREQTQHFLKLNCKRFVHNKTFIFVAFNIIQRHEFLKNLNLMTKKNYFKNLAPLIASLTKKDIDEEIINVINNGNISNSKVKLLLSQSIAVSKYAQGSRFNLKKRRTEIHSYIVSKGLPSFYITINPNDTKSPLIKFLTKIEMSEDFFQTSNLFERMQIIFTDPVSQSLHFDIIIQNLIDHLFGFTNENKIGIFGKLDAFYGMVEAQFRGSLHVHFLIWIKDSIDPSNFDDFLQNEDNKRKIIEYLNNCIKSNFSDFKTKNNDLLINKHDSVLSNTIGYLNNSVIDLEQFKDDVTKIAFETNIHNCTDSCFKNNKKKCRHGFGGSGKPLIKETFFNAQNKIEFKRDHPFLNNFNPYILISLRCNHDIKWLERAKSDSMAAIYYITNYVTKSGVSCHNFLSFALTYFEKLPIALNDDLNIAKKMLQKIFSICTSQTEFSGAQIAHMLFNKGYLL